MSAVIQGQQTYSLFPPFAEPGQIADCTYNEIQSFIAAEVIQPGRAVEIASDGLSVQQVQQSGSTLSPIGFSVWVAAREGAGAYGITAYGVGGPQYNIGDTVPVLMRGRLYVEWKGTTQTAFGTPNVYHSSTTAADRGKLTDASTSTVAGSEVATAPMTIRVRQTLSGSGNIALVDVNMPGAAS
jgi:hypothetical protein